ncbi:hypothetical protein C943_00279 [Mariniradius saccharolyticus AK6]|uniref:Uncharacterized protein n=1 Tax=Mariniradius saccharolyticus AK6 TaxID=1239962 RepID=M7XWW9_9BACT|nr:hypothetical protein C943_00279 [Mariniradius saccharolyticus AK6]
MKITEGQPTETRFGFVRWRTILFVNSPDYLQKVPILNQMRTK